MNILVYPIFEPSAFQSAAVEVTPPPKRRRKGILALADGYVVASPGAPGGRATPLRPGGVPSAISVAADAGASVAQHDGDDDDACSGADGESRDERGGDEPSEGALVAGGPHGAADDDDDDGEDVTDTLRVTTRASTAPSTAQESDMIPPTPTS